MDEALFVPPEPKRPLSLTRGGLIASVLPIALAIMCVRFGFWQLDRLEQKRARNAAVRIRMQEPPLALESLPGDSAGLIFRRVTLSGNYDDERTVIIAGRALGGSPGVHVLTPLRLGGRAVLVNRGWLPSADAATVDMGSIREPGPDGVAAMIIPLASDPRSGERENASGFQRVWHRVNATALAKQFPYPLVTYLVQLLPDTKAANDHPVRLGPPALDEGPHLGYAIQWFSFAVIAIAGWLILVFRRGAGLR